MIFFYLDTINFEIYIVKYLLNFVFHFQNFMILLCLMSKFL